MLVGEDRRDLIAHTMPRVDADDVLKLRAAVTRVHASDALISYVQALLAESRRHPQVRVGLSPRAGLALLRVARALALLRGRDYAQPDDVQSVFEEVAAHRLVPQGDSGDRQNLSASILRSVAVD